MVHWGFPRANVRRSAIECRRRSRRIFSWRTSTQNRFTISIEAGSTVSRFIEITWPTVSPATTVAERRRNWALLHRELRAPVVVSFRDEEYRFRPIPPSLRSTSSSYGAIDSLSFFVSRCLNFRISPWIIESPRSGKFLARVLGGIFKSSPAAKFQKKKLHFARETGIAISKLINWVK